MAYALLRNGPFPDVVLDTLARWIGRFSILNGKAIAQLRRNERPTACGDASLGGIGNARCEAAHHDRERRRDHSCCQRCVGCAGLCRDRRCTFRGGHSFGGTAADNVHRASSCGHVGRCFRRASTPDSGRLASGQIAGPRRHELASAQAGVQDGIALSRRETFERANRMAIAFEQRKALRRSFWRGLTGACGPRANAAL